MRKEPQPRKGTGFMNLLFLVVLIWIGYSVYQQGYLDNLLRDANIGREPITSLKDVTCQEVKEDAIGEKLDNRETGVVVEIIAIRDFVEVSRTQSELVCRGELLTDDGGANDVLKATISDWDGKFMIQYSAYPEYQEGIYEELLDLIDDIN